MNLRIRFFGFEKLSSRLFRQFAALIKSCLWKSVETARRALCNINFYIASAVFLFFVLNAAKVAAFNFYIVADQNRGMLVYKLYTSFLLVLIFYPVILRIKSRIVFIVIYFVQALYIVVNVTYYSYFHNYLNILQSVLLFKESFVTASHFAVPFFTFQLIVFLDLPFFAIIAFFYKRIYSAGTRLYLYRMATVLTSAIILISLEVKSHANGNSLKSMIGNEFLGESRVVEKYGTVVNNLTGLFLKKNESELIKSFRYGKEISGEAQAEEKPNIVILQVESMDSNIVNKKHGGRYVTPFLHSLKRESVYYPYMMSYHEGGCTSDAEFSVINSIEPLEEIPAIKLMNYTYPNSMIAVLRKNSYKALAFHGNGGEFFNRNVAFPKMGFDRFFDINAMKLQHAGWGAPDHELGEFVTRHLKRVERPFISYVITMTSHGPFTNVRHCRPENPFPDVKDETARNYLHSMSYVDQSLREIVSRLKSEFANTYIILYGDHTPGVKNDDYRQASVLAEGKNFEFVPLYIITPDGKKFIETRKVASMLDIAPTALRISGVRYRIKSDGEDLLDFGGLSNEIPFQKGSYDRSYLYRLAK